MTNKLLMPQYRVENALNKASDTAYIFATLKEKLKSLIESRDKRINDSGGSLSPTWIFLSFFFMLSAVGCAIFGAFNAKTAIAGLVDPMGEGIINPKILIIIGVSISIAGMLFGHMIYEGIADGFTTDRYTGSKIPNSKLWYSVIGIIAACIYIGTQFYIVKTAGQGAELKEGSGINHLPYVIVCISLIELLIGALVLNRVSFYLLIFILTLAIIKTLRKMNSSARITNTNYREYLRFLDAYNHENPKNTIQSEGNSNIRIAIAHYSGINLQENGQANRKQEQVPQQVSSNKKILPVSSTENISGEIGPQQEDNSQINNFLDDTVDNDLTV